MKIQLLLSGMIAALAAPHAPASNFLSLTSQLSTKKVIAPRIPMFVCAPSTEMPHDGLDVVLEQLDKEGRSKESVGERVINSDGQQTLATAVAPEQTQNYLIRIKNMGQSSTAFQLTLRGIPTATGNETVWNPKGWSARATLDGQTSDILAKLKSEQGWATPRIDMGEEAIVRLSLTAPTTALPLAEGSFRFGARNGTQSDAVIGRVGPQFIAKIQWTLDGDESHKNRWHDVTEATVIQVTRHASLGVRAEKAVPSAPWGDNEVLGPTWTFQGNKVEGDEVWLGPQATALLGAPVTATLGNSTSFQVRVLPDPYVTLTVDKGYAVLAPNATQTLPRLVSIKVEDEDDNPLAQTKVRLRAFNGKNAVVSFWTPPGKDKATQSADEVLVTNNEGEVQVQWSAATGVVAVGNDIVFKAEVVDEQGEPFGEDDTFKITVYEEEIE